MTKVPRTIMGMSGRTHQASARLVSGNGARPISLLCAVREAIITMLLCGSGLNIAIFVQVEGGLLLAVARALGTDKAGDEGDGLDFDEHIARQRARFDGGSRGGS